MVEDQTVPLGASRLASFALLVQTLDWDHAPPEKIEAFFDVVAALVREEQAIALRVAQLLVWIKRQDLGATEFTSWTAFVAEHAPWKGTWARQIMRLMESGLTLVMDAVARDALQMTIAVRAPRELGRNATEEAQAAWIRDAALTGETWPKRSQMDVLSAEDARTVTRARDLARLLLGWDAPVPALDAFIFQCWQEETTGSVLLERARATLPPPPRLSATTPIWNPPDRSDGLLEPWAEPADLHQALRTLEDVNALHAGREPLLGMAYTIIRVHAFWQETGADSLEDFTRDRLGHDVRTFQRYASHGHDLFIWPQIRAEMEHGLSFDRAAFVAERTSERTLPDLLDLAKRLGRAELARASAREDVALEAYAPALERARAMETTETVGVALRDIPEPERAERRCEPDYLFAPAGLLAAAAWLVAEVVLKEEHGPRATAKHDRHTCQNPLCRRRTVRVHVHHVDERQHGGTDDSWNLIALCPACHLRGVHSGRMTVVRDGDFLIWSWPTHAPIVMYAPCVRSS